MGKLLVFGGSGVVGRGVLEAASADSRWTTLALQRRPVEPALPRVAFRKMDNFIDQSDHKSDFIEASACIFALGISQSLVSSETEYRRITIDYAVEAAKRLAEGSPTATFVFVSGAGSDPTGKSRILFAKAKGEAENLLRSIAVGRLVIARPAVVTTDRWPREPQWSERLTLPLFKVLGPIAKGSTITSADLGRALVAAAVGPTRSDLLDNRELRRLASEPGAA